MINRLMREKKLLEAQLRDANNLADQWAQRNIALEAECERLKNSLLAITARHFAESWKKRTSDAELEQYLSAGIAQLEAERDKLHMQLAACGVVALANTPESAAQARQMHPDYMSASCSDVADAVDREMTLRQQLAERDAEILEQCRLNGMGTERELKLMSQRDKLAQVLENVEREHDLIRRMKNCEIYRSRGSFGIAVMSDPLALEWQALDKELQQLIDARRAALKGGEA